MAWHYGNSVFCMMEIQTWVQAQFYPHVSLGSGRKREKYPAAAVGLYFPKCRPVVLSGKQIPVFAIHEKYDPKKHASILLKI